MQQSCEAGPLRLVISSVVVILLISPALTTFGLSQECTRLQLQFASASSEFTTCLGKNTKPVRICVTCFNDFVSVNSSFHNISESIECSEELLDSDNAMVIRRLWDAYNNMWESALCGTCSGLTENRTHEFINKTQDVVLCFNQHYDHRNLICIECNDKYEALLNEFKSLQSAGYACADLADSMNTTARSWSVKYGCGHPPVEYVPVLAMTAAISLTPVIFYLAVWKFPTCGLS